jgi:hypothetical protein
MGNPPVTVKRYIPLQQTENYTHTVNGFVFSENDERSGCGKSVYGWQSQLAIGSSGRFGTGLLSGGTNGYCFNLLFFRIL